MGLITREGTAPILDGETASGTEVEAELDKLFTLLNGNLENVNFSATAEIDGAKFATNTIAAGQIQNATLSTQKLAESAVPRAGSASVTGTSASTTESVTFIVIDDLDPVFVTAHKPDEIIVMMLTLRFQWAEGVANTERRFYGFRINGSDVTAGFESKVASATPGSTEHSVHAVYAQPAGTTGTFTIQGVHRFATPANNFITWGTSDTSVNRMLTAFILPEQ